MCNSTALHLHPNEQQKDSPCSWASRLAPTVEINVIYIYEFMGSPCAAQIYQQYTNHPIAAKWILGGAQYHAFLFFFSQALFSTPSLVFHLPITLVAPTNPPNKLRLLALYIPFLTFLFHLSDCYIMRISFPVIEQ